MREIARIKPIERRTWRTWPEWRNFMEKIDAHKLDHHGLVLKAYEGPEGEIENVGWWTQAITAAYEQHIGRRIPVQRSNGTFQNKSK